MSETNMEVGTKSISGEPEEASGHASVRTLLSLAAIFGAEVLPSRETEIPYGYVCTACGLHVHAEDCSPPRGLRRVAAGFSVEGRE